MGTSHIVISKHGFEISVDANYELDPKKPDRFEVSMGNGFTGRDDNSVNIEITNLKFVDIKEMAVRLTEIVGYYIPKKDRKAFMKRLADELFYNP